MLLPQLCPKVEVFILSGLVNPAFLLRQGYISALAACQSGLMGRIANPFIVGSNPTAAFPHLSEPAPPPT